MVDTMASFIAQLGGNPFGTPVGQKIEQATDASLASENWAINMEICDLINETEDGPKDAIKAIKKRLQQNAGKNYTVVMYTLTVLETCVKNCGKRFHLFVTQKDFVQEMIKLIGPKNDPPTAVQEKVLSLIQTWADAFQANPDMQGVVQVCNDLKHKGIEFPMTDVDSMAPIHTPQRSVPYQQSLTSPLPEPTLHAAPLITGPVMLNGKQMSKLRQELDIVQSNMRVFGDMLNELTPGQGHTVDLELLQDIHKTCQEMQSRLVDLIDKVANEQVTSELLHLNDELNNLFVRYERFDKKQLADSSQPTSPKQKATLPEQAALIDFSEPEATSAEDIQVQLAGMSIGPSTLSQIHTVTATNAASKDEFDMLAHSRKTNFDTKSQQESVSTESAASKPPLELETEDDFKEMERWLQDKPSRNQPESISSTEFDQFLAERSATAGPPRTPRRQMDKDDKESKLFAL